MLGDTTALFTKTNEAMEEPKRTIYDLQERLIQFAALLIELVRSLPNDRVGNYLGGQLLRSGTSPALHYGEAQAAESRKDFVHKMKVCLKELRETQNCLKIMDKVELLEKSETLVEAGELVAIFTSSVNKAERRGNP